ncbi:MAG: M48 family metallopeptidase [Gammaproteobacteria bacterium]
MMKALIYEAASSARHEVEVSLLATGSLQLRDGRDIRSWLLSDLQVDERLAGRPAVITMPGGERLEIADAEQFYREYAGLHGGGSSWVHALERHWGVVLVSLLATVGLVYWFVTAGIPVVARIAADAMPVEVNDLIGRESLEAMDRYLFEPTQLNPARQAELQALFDDVVSEVGGEENYSLRLRSGEQIGPNAFALPAGIVIMTDELVELAEEDAEIAAVLAHEVGHVVNRHSMRLVLQSSVSTGVIIAITGDVGSAANLAVGLPAVLLNASYSREFEREADQVAFDYLEARDIDLAELGELLVRIDEAYGRDPDASTLLDSHPGSRERLEAARAP